MIIGFNAFGEENNLAFDDRICHLNYNKLEITKGMIDQIYIDEDITIPYSTVKPNEWRYQTVLNAKFNGNLEGGSVEADNIQIEKIRFQRRRWDELEWQDVAEIEYKPNEKLLYEAIDKYIANDFIYQYSIVPMTSTIMGNRIISDEITAKFEGIFISDKDSNYELLYDIELSDIMSIELIYYWVPINKEIQPVYKIYLDLKNTSNYDDYFKGNELNLYGIFYVPAIESKYLDILKSN